MRIRVRSKAGGLFVALIMAASCPPAVAAGADALAGKVASAEEGPMEGVLVSAKRADSAVTVTVVSRQDGHYAFPADRLEPGDYAVAIRAVGYELPGPVTVHVPTSKAAVLDLKLRRTKNLAAQLTNTEWLMSVPGTETQKRSLAGCIYCHNADRIVGSHYTADEFVPLMQRMLHYFPGSVPERPQVAPDEWAIPSAAGLHDRAQYFSSINLSAKPTWDYPLKTLPRPKGKATRIIITKYELPRPEALPHDALVGNDGRVWYSDFGASYIGVLDPKTAKVTDYRYPDSKGNNPKGGLDLEQDKDGNLWLGTMDQGGVARFDPKTERFTQWATPKDAFLPHVSGIRIAMVQPTPDGKVWFSNLGLKAMHRLDPSSGNIETFVPSRMVPAGEAQGIFIYGISADDHGNGYFLDIGGGRIGRIDGATGKVSLFSTTTRDSGPRRGHMDSHGRIWFGQYFADRIGVFDTATKQFRDWAVPTRYTFPYDAVADKNGLVWSGGEFSDRVLRLNPKNGDMTEYLLPDQFTDIRRVDVDNATNPATFWVGNTHGAAILKLETSD